MTPGPGSGTEARAVLEALRHAAITEAERDGADVAPLLPLPPFALMLPYPAGGFFAVVLTPAQAERLAQSGLLQTARPEGGTV